MTSKDDNTSVSSLLQNKLGSTTQLWSFGSTVVSQYTFEKLLLIKECFPSLDSLVKFKFFLTLFHIPKRNLDEQLIDNTLQTCLDQWVLSIAMFVQSYWLTQSLNTEVEYDLESYKEANTELKRILKEFVESEAGFQQSRYLFPIECDYLNKNSLFSIFPNNTVMSNDLLSQLVSDNSYDISFNKKHFNLVKASKIISQIDELKSKAGNYFKSKTTTKSLLHNTSLSNLYCENEMNIFNTNSSLVPNLNKTVPYLNRFSGHKKIESFNDSYSSKILTNTSSSFFKRSMLTNTSNTTTITGKSSSLKRDVGIKLLDAQEQSASPKEAKRRRKEYEKEALKKLKFEQTEKEKLEKEKSKSDTISARISNESQNYHTNMEKNESLLEDTLSNMQQSKLSYMQDISYETNEIADSHQQISTFKQNNIDAINYPLNQPNLINNSSISDQENGKDYLNVLQQHSQKQLTSLYEQSFYNDILQPQKFNNLSIQHHIIQSSNQDIASNFSNKSIMNRENNNICNLSYNNFDSYTPSDLISGNIENQNSNMSANENNQSNSFSSTQLPTFTTMSTITSLPSSSNSASNDLSNKFNPQHQSLSLTREQMLQAQEMFNNSNKLTRPEKALILGFIAGSRENPRPEHGSLISIKLNESEEILTSSNGQQHKVLSELYFQMNYDTGEYKKIKKLKPI